jgi:hypothetical protein
MQLATAIRSETAGYSGNLLLTAGFTMNNRAVGPSGGLPWTKNVEATRDANWLSRKPIGFG